MLKLEKRIIDFLNNKPTNGKMLITLEVIHECGEMDIKDSKTKLYFELAYNCVKTLYEQNKDV